MEDALISPMGLAILTNAGLIKASEKDVVMQHATETSVVSKVGDVMTVHMTEKPYFVLATEDAKNTTEYMVDNDGNFFDHIYVMKFDGNDFGSEPYLVSKIEQVENGYDLTLVNTKDDASDEALKNNDTVLIDFYVEKKSGAYELTIDVDTSEFAGNFYVEASTLFRDTDGADHAAEFIIPNAKVQSNFTFSMASSGDPSTFNFVLDAFPGETRFKPGKKVLAVLQVIDDGATGENTYRTTTTQTDPAGTDKQKKTVTQA